MRKFNSSLKLLPIALVAVGALSGCNNDDNVRVLHVYNSEDYIYEAEEEGFYCEECEDYIDEKYVKYIEAEDIYVHGDEEHKVYYDESMTRQFEDYWLDLTGEKVKVVYDTYDTNETMFNELQTGKSTYDVICTSDYMIQKLITNNMLHAFKSYENTTEEGIWENISSELSGRFENIRALPKGEEEEVSIYDYSVPYMWGTIGIMYNPEFYMEYRGIVTDEEDPNFDQEAYDNALNSIKNDFNSWEVLYDTDPTKGYSGNFFIKDSVRDAYAVSLIHTFKDEIAAAVASGNTEELAKVFNQSDEETIAKVEADMALLKANAFGFETDSGKTDMVDEKVGADMCWSGDATWAIWVAEDPSLEARDDGKEVEPLDLYFTVPTGENGDEASNIWFDALALCENESSDEHQYEIAQAFIEFLCQPENAVQNCDAVGYTPGTAGEEVLQYMYETYDVRGEIGGEIPEGFEEDVDYVKYDLTYFYGDENTTGGEDPDAVLYAYPEYIDRQLTAQYPLAEDLPRLAVMNNFPEKDTANLLSMWERVRTNALPTWAVILFIVEAVAGVAFIGLLVYKKVIRKKLRKARM